MKYNFMIVSVNYPIYDYIFSEVQNLPYAIFDNHFPYKKPLRILHNIHWNRRLNNEAFQLPFKGLWIGFRIRHYKRLSGNFREKREGLCFVLLGDCIKLEKYNFSRRLKQEMPKSKIIYYFADIASADLNRKRFMETTHDAVDYIVTYDYGDAERYGLRYHNVPFSLPNIHMEEKNEYDVCFIGKAKNRLSEIIAAYKYMIRNGINCKFIVVGAKRKDRLKEDGIVFLYQNIGYDKYLETVKKSKCILEIIQKDSDGATLRVYEARLLGKLLLSNNGSLKNNVFYDSRFMRIYEDIEKVNLKDFLSIDKAAYSNNDCLLPGAFLKDMEDMLEGACDESVRSSKKI